MEEIFNRVENVLKKYPSDWTKNYYKNKETVKINVTGKYVKGIVGLEGEYIDSENYIEVRTIQSLPHELFHMAFSDKEKYHTKIFSEREYPLYDNGIFMFVKREDGDKKINKGINEGFTEYLARKSGKKCGQDINYYFADLLISIFGEDLLKYSFKCDPIGFYADPRFDYINIFTNNLDGVNENIDYLMLYNGYINEEDMSIRDKKELLKTLFMKYNYSLIETFESIINEYNKYSDKLICREKFNQKLSDFLTNYDFYKSFDNEECNVKRFIKGNIR